MKLYIFRCRTRNKLYGATQYETASNLPTDQCSAGWEFFQRVDLSPRGALRFAVDTPTLRRAIQRHGWYIWDEAARDTRRIVENPETKPVAPRRPTPPPEAGPRLYVEPEQRMPALAVDADFEAVARIEPAETTPAAHALVSDLPATPAPSPREIAATPFEEPPAPAREPEAPITEEPAASSLGRAAPYYTAPRQGPAFRPTITEEAAPKNLEEVEIRWTVPSFKDTPQPPEEAPVSAQTDATPARRPPLRDDPFFTTPVIIPPEPPAPRAPLVTPSGGNAPDTDTDSIPVQYSARERFEPPSSFRQPPADPAPAEVTAYPDADEENDFPRNVRPPRVVPSVEPDVEPVQRQRPAPEPPDRVTLPTPPRRFTRPTFEPPPEPVTLASAMDRSMTRENNATPPPPELPGPRAAARTETPANEIPAAAGQARHHVVWFDIPVRDMDRALRFYAAVLGIELTKKQAGPGAAIALLPHTEGFTGGCLVHNMDAKPSESGPLLYLNTQGRLDEALNVVEKHGGKILAGRHSIEPFGFRAVVLDSEGNRVALHSM